MSFVVVITRSIFTTRDDYYNGLSHIYKEIWSPGATFGVFRKENLFRRGWHDSTQARHMDLILKSCCTWTHFGSIDEAKIITSKIFRRTFFQDFPPSLLLPLLGLVATISIITRLFIFVRSWSTYPVAQSEPIVLPRIKPVEMPVIMGFDISHEWN